jgi:hypothetical protein
MDAPPRSFPVANASPLLCLRCSVAMDFAGTKWFQEGGFAAEIGNLFSNCDRLDVHVCPKCGRLEFFASAVGEPARSSAPTQEALRPANSAEAMLKEGSALAGRGEAEAAVACFEQVSVRFPGTNYSRDAERLIREIRDKLGI